jgi:hypothetical protein
MHSFANSSRYRIRCFVTTDQSAARDRKKPALGQVRFLKQDDSLENRAARSIISLVRLRQIHHAPFLKDFPRFITAAQLRGRLVTGSTVISAFESTTPQHNCVLVAIEGANHNANLSQARAHTLNPATQTPNLAAACAHTKSYTVTPQTPNLRGTCAH